MRVTVPLALAGALSAALSLLTGCSGPGARRFAVTVTDATTIACTATARDSVIDQSSIDGVAQGQESSFAAARRSTPPLPDGRELQTIEADGEVRAWFEVLGNGNDLGTIAGPTEVYLGVPQEDYIDAAYVRMSDFNNFQGPEGSSACGTLPFVVAQLLATAPGSRIKGQIRRQEISYLTDQTSACAAEVRCARDLEVEGVESN